MTLSVDLVNELRSLIARNPRDVVLVVGAGVTIGALQESRLREVASWRGLLHAGLEHAAACGLCNEAEQAAIRDQLAGEEPGLWIAGAERIVRAMGGSGGGELKRWLRGTVGAFAGEVRDAQVLEALRELQARGAILATVNYDGLLEDTTGAPPVTWRDPSRVERVIRGDERGILHLHGYWEEPRSVVFGTESYEAVSGDAHAQAVLRALRMTKTLVFMGHGAGLQDPNWGRFLRWMEDVFAGSEYRHYRLVRKDERERVQAEHRPGQQITALVYGERHEELGPFLRSLVPAAPADLRGSAREGGAAAVRETVVVLRINIGDREFDWLSEEAIRAKVVEKFPGAEPLLLPELRWEVDREAISPRQWRAIARDLMARRDLAKAAVPVGSPVRYVVAGQAPLPVFAFLGQLMERMPGPITTFNRRPGSDKWDVAGPMEMAERGADIFTVETPELGREREGRVVLSIRCSNTYPYEEEMVESVIKGENARLLCSYKITNTVESHQRRPMGAGELAVLLDHVRTAESWISARCPRIDGLVVAFGGPSWVAFWIGRALNPYRLGGRVDFLNMVGGGGRHYVRALSSPMHKASWLAGRARLMFVGAEPDNASRTGGARAAGAIQGVLEQELGRESPTYQIRVCGAVTVKEFLRELDLYEPDILHMHLHGSADGEGALIFESEGGTTQPVPAEAVIEMLRSSKARPALVVLSACKSAALAPLLLEEIAECVVFMTGEVKYTTLTEFSQVFYGALARGRSLAKAIELGRGAVHGKWGKTVQEKLDWKSALEVNAEDIVLLPGRRGSGL